MDRAAHDHFDARLRWLENEVGRLRADLEAARAGTVTPGTPTTPGGAEVPFPALVAPLRAATVAGAAGARSALSLETLVAGRGLQLAGLLLLLVGTAYFLELAFSRNWLGPLERVLLGLVAGTALMAAGARLRAMRYLAEGLIGLGAGILYLSLWAAVGLFHLVGQPPALIAMVAVTAALGALAFTRHSERLALMGLFGGFITPLLLASGTVEHVLLATYLLILSAAMLALALRAGFRWVETAALAAALCYVPSFEPDFAHGWDELAAYVTATLFFALFATAFSLGALRAGGLDRTRLTLLCVASGGYAGALAALLWDHQTPLGAALIGLAASLLIATRAVPAPPPLRLAYGYLGLAALSLAVPALLHADALVDAFAVEGALLVGLGARGGARRLALSGLALLGCTTLYLLARATFETMLPPLIDPLFLAFAVTAGALLVALRELRAHDLGGSFAGRPVGVVRVAFNVVVLTGLSRQCIDLLDGGRGFEALSSHAQLALSLLWTAYASVLFALGMRRRDAGLRWQGIVLFGLTIAKVFLIDLATLDSVYRVVSFVGLGVVLVAASAWYQHAFGRSGAPVAAAAPAAPTPEAAASPSALGSGEAQE